MHWLLSRSRKRPSSVPASGESEGQAEQAAATFFSPENREFPYNLVYKSLSGKWKSTKKKLFRLVRILPGSGEDPIKCELLPSKLGSGTAYEALSYCAGDPADCLPILLNGFPFNTFRSTFEAIRRFRDCRKTMVMWIDQICINQKDIGERDNQVLLMADIYKNAAATQIWLGGAASDPPSDLAFDLLNSFLKENRTDVREHIMQMGVAQPGYSSTGDLARDYLHAEDSWFKYYNKTSLKNGEGRQDLRAQKIYQWFRATCCDSSRLKQWHALFQLFDRPWWRRCWVVQEAVVSIVLLVNCGSSTIAWEDLCLLFNTWYIICRRIWNVNIFLDNSLKQSMLSCAEISLNIHRLRMTPTNLVLEAYLRFLRESLASDPRDKVYSALGMLGDRARQAYAIVPNYAPSNSIVEVYIAAAIAILKVDSNPTMLANISGRESENGLPSWVPDWSQPRNRTLGNTYYLFEAGSGRSMEGEILEDGLSLKLHGSLIDVIEAIGPVDSGDVLEVLTTWEKLFVDRLQEKNDLRALDTFYRTLAFDMWSIDTGDLHGDPREFRRVWDQALGVFREDSERNCQGCRFFMSRSSSVPGMAPQHAQEGDAVFIPWGSMVPFAVRRCSERVGNRYQLIGPCYLHGMMHGEVFKQEDAGQVKSEDVYLV